jgi:hypothetical protein
MPYFDTVIPEYDSAEILNLCRIVELCNPPDVGPSPLDPDLTPEARHTNALTTLEKTSGVFDDAFYQDAVLSDQVPESLLDESLLEKARAKEVPEDHLPNKCMRTPPPCPAPPITIQPPSPYLAQIAKFPTAPNSPVPSDSKPKLRSLDLQRLNNAPESQPRPSLSRPSLSLPSLRSFLTLSPSSNSVRLPTPTNSVTSFFSGSSRMSLRNYAKRGKRRDTLRNLFRRDYTFSQRPSPLDETMAWNPSSASESASESAAPSLDSSTVTHDQSSVQSSSLSSRTSTSSFIDIPTLSWLDNRTLQQSVKTPRFTSLQIRCQNEGKRFIDFAQHQRVALPLFLGRTRVYLEGRMATRVAEMKKRVCNPYIVAKSRD